MLSFIGNRSRVTLPMCVALAAVVLLAPLGVLGNRSAQQAEKLIHCAVYPEGSRCFATVQEADSFAAEYAANYALTHGTKVASINGAPSGRHTNGGWNGRLYAAINYNTNYASVVFWGDHPDLRDMNGAGTINFNDVISSVDMYGSHCIDIYPAINYQRTSSLPYARGICGDVPDLRDKRYYSTGWIYGENWNDVISSIWDIDNPAHGYGNAERR